VIICETITTLLLAFVATSAFLHYYYDGFIWKVREKDTRANLGIEATGTATPQEGLLSSAKSAWDWLQRLQPNYQRGVFQAGYLGCALVVLGSLEIYRPHDDLSMHQALSVVASDSDVAQMRLGESLRVRGKNEQATAAYRAALRANPSSAQARVMLGLMLFSQGQFNEAATYYEEALQADPNIAEAHFNLAAILESRGEIPAATKHFAAAARSEDEQVRRPALEALSRLRAKR
jgi:tetratricopeptide (TPR) repeat protein